MEFSITKADIVIPERCPVLGIPFNSGVDVGKRLHHDSKTLDRIDNSKGYVKGNIQVISGRANAMKNDASPDELKAFANWVNKTYG